MGKKEVKVSKPKIIPKTLIPSSKAQNPIGEEKPKGKPKGDQVA